MASVLTRSIHVTRRVRGTPEQLFDAWLDADVARRWLFATATEPMTQVEIDARVGGSFRFVDDRRNVEHTGIFLKIDPPRRLVFKLSGDGDATALTRVTVDIVRHLNNCAVAVVHDGVPRARARYFADRWRGMLYGLDETLASPRAVRTRRSPITSHHPTIAWRNAP